MARAVDAVLHPSGTAPAIEPSLARSAILRHRIGPLIAAGTGLQLLTTDASTAELLSAHARQNERRGAIAGLLQAVLVADLARAAIPVLVVKGLPLADLLYPQRNWRHCGDIDLLVPPQDIEAAAQRFADRLGTGSDPRLPFRGPGATLARALIRDVRFHDPATGLLIELHQRLFVVDPSDWNWHSADFMPRLPQKEEIPAPVPGPALALYLLLHGAVSGWGRLKWLVDLRLLLDRLTANEAAAMVSLAETCGVAATVKASLLLLLALLDAPLPAPLEAWIKEKTAAAAVARRMRYYLERLNAPDRELFRTRRDAMWRNLLLCETPEWQLKVLLAGPIASGVRLAARP